MSYPNPRALQVVAMVLGIEASKRAKAISEYCKGNRTLEQEVHDLLAFERAAEAYLDLPLAESRALSTA